MREITGIELHDGDFVEVMVGTNWVPGTIQKIDESALLMQQKPGQMPIVKLVVMCEFNIPTISSAISQPCIRRIPHPEYERIVRKGN
jgi:hypothetical protein